MAKLIMMKGLPGSGKTTRAMEMLKEYGNYVRVNKDDLRGMLHKGLDWNGKQEKLTKAIEYDMVEGCLINGNSVIVDDTNLRDADRSRWSQLAAIQGAKFEVVEMDTPFEYCVFRDQLRDNPVGTHVIAGMALRNGLFPYKKIVLCDIDGTLADIQHRLHYIKDGNKDWDSFFDACWDDTFREDIWEQVETYAQENDAVVVFLSGRSDIVRAKTERWLAWHTGDRDPIVLMRPKWDRRPDTDLKKQLFEQHFGGYEIIRVFDDRPRLVRMWKELGLDVINCGTGEEF